VIASLDRHDLNHRNEIYLFVKLPPRINNGDPFLIRFSYYLFNYKSIIVNKINRIEQLQGVLDNPNISLSDDIRRDIIGKRDSLKSQT